MKNCIEAVDTLRVENEQLQQRIAELEQFISKLQDQLTTLQMSEARYRGLVESQHDCIMRADSEGRVTFVNEAYCRVLNITPEIMLGQPFATYIYPDDLPVILEAIKTLEVSADRVYPESRIITPQGLRWFAWEGTAIKAADGTTLEVQAVGRDITNYKELVNEVQRLNVDLEQRVVERTAEAERQTHLLNLILNQMSDGVIVADTEGRFLVFNAVAAQMFGDSAMNTRQVERSAHYKLFLSDQATPFPSDDLPLSRALQGEATNNIEMFVQHPESLDGYWVMASGRPLQDEAGTLRGGVSVYRDITEHRKQEAEYAALQQQVIDSQQMAIRELSTPLIPISDNAVAMPLIGTIDSSRAQQIMETLLEGIATHQATIVILDITGVQVVDTQVANALVRAAQAVKLLGAQVVLTGIRPEVAQTLVHLGAELSGIVTQSTLQAGIVYALQDSPVHA